MPAKLTSRFRWVTNQIVHFCRAEIAGIYLDQDPPSTGVDPALRCALALPLNLASRAGKGLFHELSHRMRFAGRQNIIIWFGLLDDEPHAFNIIACVPPVTPGVEISKIELFLVTIFDRDRKSTRLNSSHLGIS